MINGVILYTLAIILTGISFMKDRKKTKDALMKSWKMFRNLLPAMLSIMLFVGLSLSILTPSFISSIIGEQSGLLGIIYSAILGSIALIPSFVVFPLGHTLVQHGAGLPQVAALMSTFMSVGITTLPMEQKIFGRSFAHVTPILLYHLGGASMKELKKYRFFFILLMGLFVLTFINQSLGWSALQLTGNSILDMLFLLPPVLLFVGLLDQWVKKETLMKYMGEKSGIYGILFSLLLGGIAAGPLYVAFPIAALLLNKGASIRYIVFFLGVWTTAKFPILVYEFSSFGATFTLIHIGFGLVFFYVMGLIFERFYDQGQLLRYDVTKEM